MDKFKKYSLAISIVAFVAIAAQIVCSACGMNFDTSIIVELSAAGIAGLVSIGLLKREGEAESLDELKSEIKEEIITTVEENKSKINQAAKNTDDKSE